MNDQYRQKGVEHLNTKINQLNNLIDKGNFSRHDLDEIYQAIKQVCDTDLLEQIEKSPED